MLRKHLPNLMTLTNLALGVLAILLAASADRILLQKPGKDISLIYLSCLLIMAAAIFDRFDGKLARKLNVVSELGKQLDSLSDLISFGVAPAIIAWKLHFSQTSLFFPVGRVIGFILALSFTIAGAIRLAHYNLQEEPDYYYGIPITLAGSVLTLMNLLHTYLIVKFHFRSVHVISCMILMAALTILMISKIHLKKI
ncbi:MAG: CDP-alcohol phosphatidyltransferase family protein [Clostridia bacterium]|nr:CDP-alcohol phosphatidyltransferase family protein [Clostridia bacterium]